MDKRIIFGIIAILIVLGIAFLSQQAFIRGFGKEYIYDFSEQAKNYMSKGIDWAGSAVLSRIGGEVEKRGDMIKQEIAEEKNKISENILDKTKNYFSGIAESIIHPGNPQNCPAPAQASPQ